MVRLGPIVREKVVPPEAQTPRAAKTFTGSQETFSVDNTNSISFAEEKKKYGYFYFSSSMKWHKKYWKSEEMWKTDGGWVCPIRWRWPSGWRSRLLRLWAGRWARCRAGTLRAIPVREWPDRSRKCARRSRDGWPLVWRSSRRACSVPTWPSGRNRPAPPATSPEICNIIVELTKFYKQIPKNKIRTIFR